MKFTLTTCILVLFTFSLVARNVSITNNGHITLVINDQQIASDQTLAQNIQEDRLNVFFTKQTDTTVTFNWAVVYINSNTTYLTLKVFNEENELLLTENGEDSFIISSESFQVTEHYFLR